jgi:hypothetical protein
MLSCFHRYHALKLGHGLQGLGIQCPAIEVTDVVFKQWGHSRAARLDVPIMAGVVCIHPVQPNESNKGANSKLAGALVEESTKLRPSGMSGSKKKERIGQRLPWKKIYQYIKWRRLLPRQWHQPFWHCVHVLNRRPDEPLERVSASTVNLNQRHAFIILVKRNVEANRTGTGDDWSSLFTILEDQVGTGCPS